MKGFPACLHHQPEVFHELQPEDLPQPMQREIAADVPVLVFVGLKARLT